MRVLDGIFLALFGLFLGGGCAAFFMLPNTFSLNDYATKAEVQNSLNVAAKEINGIKAWIQSVRPVTPTPNK